MNTYRITLTRSIGNWIEDGCNLHIFFIKANSKEELRKKRWEYINSLSAIGESHWIIDDVTKVN